MSEEINLDIETAHKRIRDVGTASQIIGFLKIGVSLIAPLILLTDIESGEMAIFTDYSFSDLSFNVCLGLILAILGRRIGLGPDKNTKKYVWAILLISAASGFINILLTGGISYIVILAALSIRALLKIKHAQTALEPKYTSSVAKVIIFTFSLVLIFLIGLFLDFSLQTTSETASESLKVSHEYHDTVNKFTIKFPEGWDIGPGKSSNIVQRAIQGDKNISVFVADTGTNKSSVKEFGTAEFIANQLVKNSAGMLGDVKLVDFGEVVIENETAYWVRYTVDSPAENTSFETLLYSIVKNGKLYNVSAVAPTREFDQAINTFKKTADSIRFQ
jgi:hypothetical protein